MPVCYALIVLISVGDACAFSFAWVRMGELARLDGEVRVIVSYRFADAVQKAVVDFCARALPGEALPERAEYRVRELQALDAYIDEIECAIELSSGSVYLDFQVIQTAWRYPGQSAESLEPSVGQVQAERSVKDGVTGEELTLHWDDEQEIWVRS